MTNEQILTKYVNELTNARAQLEFTIVGLRAQIEDLTKKQGSSNPDSIEQSGELHQSSSS